jgi:hypothetical protein
MDVLSEFVKGRRQDQLTVRIGVALCESKLRNWMTVSNVSVG